MCIFTCVFGSIVCEREVKPGKEFRRRAFVKRLLTKATRSSVVILFDADIEDDDDKEVEVEGDDEDKAY
jgi:hypothetical protein